MERVTRVRAGTILLLFAIVLGIFAFRLYYLQIIETGGETDNTKYFETITRVKAPRGEIVDRNGNILVTNRVSYDLILNHYVLLSTENPNQHLLNLTEMCRQRDIRYNDHFPISPEPPFSYTLDEYNSAWQGYFQRYLLEMEIDSDISAPLLLSKLRGLYNIPEEWTDIQARAVLGLRYELTLRKGNLTTLPNFVFLEDVTTDDLAALMELNIPGLKTEETTTREYTTQYAAHILGYIGAMTPEQWAEYKEQGYSMDALVGQTGLEEAFEQYLHGTDGWRIDKMTIDGTIVDSYYQMDKDGNEQRPVAGQNVELTIDLNLQIAAEDKLEEVFLDLPNQNEAYKATGGAVVVMDIDTGEILVCASYPTYDLSTFFEDYEELANAEHAPLYNRALLAAYPPGSIYKLSMTVAGMESGTITKNSLITDYGVYTKYAHQGFSASCLVHTQWGITHGDLDVSHALMCSCNYFFYELGDRMDQEYIDAVSKSLGLGEHTGIELYENLGYRANYETKKLLHSGSDAYWYPADQVMSSIGQGDNQFTPVQMCVYLTTLMNKGVRYKATFLNRVKSADYRELIYDNQPEILSTIHISDSTYDAITYGMRLAVTDPKWGTANPTLGSYQIAVGAKTGTAETGKGGADNGSYLCFAPYDDPQIAIAVYGEEVGGGGLLGPIVRSILDSYFNVDPSNDTVTNENQMG